MSAASGNAVPLTPQFLFEALQAASSQSQELVKHASAQLKDWETRPGYWSLLQVRISALFFLLPSSSNGV